MNQRGFIMPVVIILLVILSLAVAQNYRNIITTYETVFDRITYTQQYYITEAVCNAGIVHVKSNFKALIAKAQKQSLLYHVHLPGHTGTCVITMKEKDTLHIRAQLEDKCSIETCIYQKRLADKSICYVLSGWKQHGK